MWLGSPSSRPCQHHRPTFRFCSSLFSASKKSWRRVVSLSNDHDLPMLQPLHWSSSKSIQRCRLSNASDSVFGHQFNWVRSWPWRHHWHNDDSVCTRRCAVSSWLLPAQTQTTLRHVAHSLTREAANSTWAFISSRRDCCDSLLFGMSDNLVRRVHTEHCRPPHLSSHNYAARSYHSSTTTTSLASSQPISGV